MNNQSPNNEDFDLIPMQGAIWRGQLLHPEFPIYNIAYVFEIEGSLDLDAFARAHAALVATTDSLRVVMAQSEGSPRQRILSDAPSSLEVADSSALNDDDFNRLIEEVSKRPIDLKERPWISTLHRRAGDRFVWYFVQHHLFTDGYSIQLLIRRFTKLYEEALNADLDEQEIAPSFANWARGARHANLVDKGMTSPTLKLYSSRTATGNPKGERCSVQVSSDLTASLSELIALPDFESFSEELSQTLVLLTSVFALLSRLEQQPELALTVANHGRVSKEAKGIAGPLVNLSKLQLELQEEDTFSTLYQKVREVFFKHASELASPDAVLSEAEDSGVLFSFYTEEPIMFGDAAATSKWIYPDCHESVNFWRIHFVMTISGTLELVCDFNDELFNETSKQVAMLDLLATLEAFTQDPTEKVSKYTLVDQDAAHASMLRGESVEAAACANLWSRFEAIAEKHSSASAIQTESEVLSFGEFRQLVEQTSNAFSARSVEVGDIVPIVGKRSREMLQCALAAMRCGARFLPIDSDQPVKRVETIIADSEAEFSVSLDEPLDDVEYPFVEAKDCDSAYVMYTSGSTGVPNGVIVGHQSVLYLIEDFERRAPLMAGSKCMWWTSVGFDVSILEIYSTLLYGHTLCIPPESIRLKPIELFEWMSKNEINYAYLPPFMLDAFDRWLDDHVAPPLSRLTVGVEPIQEGLLQSIMKKIEGLQVVNGYGPTETTVFSTFYTVDSTIGYERQTPIGDPVMGTSCYVLDQNLNVVPQGAVGELHIGGAGLAHGYWKRPEVQSTRFIADPFSGDDPDARMYKTGDLVRMNEAKQLVFIGRKDSQIIKFRGFRIELSEIEQTMRLLRGVDRCSVSVQKIGGEDELVCFYAGPDRLSEEELITHAAAYLPFQMQARRYIHLEELPITLNGKVDDKVLAKLIPEQEAAQMVEPEGPVEAHVYQVWARVLQLESFSVHDSFYSLGASSLAVIEIIHQINRDFEIKLSQQTIFQEFTVAKLSQAIEQVLFAEISETSEEEAKRILASE